MYSGSFLKRKREFYQAAGKANAVGVVQTGGEKYPTILHDRICSAAVAIRLYMNQEHQVVYVEGVIHPKKLPKQATKVIHDTIHVQ